MKLDILISDVLNHYTNSDAFEPFITFNVMTIGFMIAIGFGLLFQRKITKKTFVYSFIFGLFYHDINNIIYQLYVDIPNYQNPQISTVIFLFSITTALIVMSLFKKTRTLDRVFATVSLTAMILIFFIVHICIVNVGVIQTLKYNNAQHEMNISMLIKDNNADGFYEYCSLHKLVCDSSKYRNPDKEIIALFDEYDSMDNAGFSMVKGKEIHYFLPGRDDVMSRSYVNVGTGGKEHSYVVVLNKSEMYTFIAYDIKDVQYIHGKYVVLFYSWYGLALLFWVYGILGLLMFHKIKLKKRLESKK